MSGFIQAGKIYLIFWGTLSTPMLIMNRIGAIRSELYRIL